MMYEISEDDIKSIDDSIKWLWSICNEFLKEPSGDNNEMSAVYALGQADREVANVYYKLSTLFEKIKKTSHLFTFSEYQETSDNPEVVAPLNKLKDMLKDVVWNQPVDLSKSIPAEKLLIKYNRGDKA